MKHTCVYTVLILSSSVQNVVVQRMMLHVKIGLQMFITKMMIGMEVVPQ
jgi:hypothetical protein